MIFGLDLKASREISIQGTGCANDIQINLSRVSSLNQLTIGRCRFQRWRNPSQVGCDWFWTRTSTSVTGGNQPFEEEISFDIRFLHLGMITFPILVIMKKLEISRYSSVLTLFREMVMQFEKVRRGKLQKLQI